MIRIILFILGFILVLSQYFLKPINPKSQFILFLIGVTILGVPHGAADLLVAKVNASNMGKVFSIKGFFLTYLSKLVLFAALLFLFPVVGNVLFVLFAAYHFGETDLSQFKTNTLAGKVFVFCYGSVILSVILVHHFEFIRPLYQLFPAGRANLSLINWIDLNRYSILSFVGITFFVTMFVYFLKNNDQYDGGHFLVRMALLVFILFHLPMLLGFTFYFVTWHSVLSLDKIVGYLKKNGTLSNWMIFKKIVFYSTLAFIGIGLCGAAGFMFTSDSAMMSYLFLGLAVLTAPHMPIMHEMYGSIRSKNMI